MKTKYFKLNKDEIKIRAIKGAGVNVLTNFISFIFHTAGVIILARLLTPKDFGLVAMVTAFSLLPMNFGINGFTSYIIQKNSLSNEEINAIFWDDFLISGAFSICFVFLGFWLVEFFAEKELRHIAAALSTTFMIVALSTTPRALLRREMKFTLIAVGDLISGVIAIIFGILAALGGMGFWAIVIRQIMVPINQVIFAYVWGDWKPKKPKNIFLGIPGILFAIKVFSNFSCDYFTKNIDKILLGKFHGSELLGNYDRALHLSSLPAGQIITPLTSVALSSLSRLKNDRVSFISFIKKSLSLLSFIGVLASVSLMLTAKDLIPLLLGKEWEQTGPIVMAFCPGIAAMFVYCNISWLHLSLGTPGNWFKWNIFVMIISVIAFSISAQFGALAMATAFSLVKILLVIPGLRYSAIPVDIKTSQIISCIWIYFAAGAITVIFWLGVPSLRVGFSEIYYSFSSIIRIVITILLAPLFYFMIVIIFERSFDSFRNVIKLFKLFLSK